MIYRVILKIGYYENWFEFNDILEASRFAEMAIKSSVPNEDRKTEYISITIKIINSSKKESEED